MRRPLVVWSVAFALLLGGFAITLVTLNGTVYSAGGFVASYLDALARQDATTARSMPGVLAAGDARSDLLTDGALGSLTDIRFVADDAGSDGVHAVTYEYDMGGELGTTTFQVKQNGAFFGLFSSWSFAESPLATVAVTVLHDHRFRANEVDLTSPAKRNKSAAYLVFAPGLYTFDHSSTYLDADPIAAPVNDPGSVTAVQVNVQANKTFVKQVTAELKDFLTECATQTVLLPTGCPFGKSFDNRVDSTPKWKMADFPKVEIIPGKSVGAWVMPEADASAHLKVKIQSLFDGSISTFNKDVPFTVAYGITVEADDELTIEAQ